MASLDRTKGFVEDSEPATFAEYLRLLKDRPPKFHAKEVGYRQARSGEGRNWTTSGEPSCRTCRHFYVSKPAKRSVCEVVRPNLDASIDPDWTCKFHTRDGINYPLLESKEG